MEEKSILNQSKKIQLKKKINFKKMSQSNELTIQIMRP